MGVKNNALNFNRLSKYNFDFISLEETILLEYLLFNHLKNNIENLSYPKIETDTGIKKARQKSNFKKLEEKGLISVQNLGNKITFTLNLDKITDSIERLFIKPNRYTYQYFYYIKNPEAFKVKNRRQPKEQKKNKEKAPLISENQMSLFD